MKSIITSYIIGAITAGLIIWMISSSYNSNLDSKLEKLHKLNDSLYSVIDSTNIKIKELDSVANEFENIIESNKTKLASLSKKANEYKNKYEKEHNRINDLSNDDVISEFTNAFE